MEGRFPPAIRTTFTRCTDPAQETAFNDWYGRQHVPDIVGSGVAQVGLRYRNAEPQDGTPDYLAIYKLDNDDLARIDAAFAGVVRRLHHEGRMHPALQIMRRAMWQRIGPESTGARTGPTPGGLFIIESDCTVQERLEEFNAWYDRTHIPDLLATGQFMTGYRFEAAAGQPGAPEGSRPPQRHHQRDLPRDLPRDPSALAGIDQTQLTAAVARPRACGLSVLPAVGRNPTSSSTKEIDDPRRQRPR